MARLWKPGDPLPGGSTGSVPNAYSAQIYGADAAYVPGQYNSSGSDPRVYMGQRTIPSLPHRQVARIPYKAGRDTRLHTDRFRSEDDVRTVDEAGAHMLGLYGTDGFAKWGRTLLDLGLIDAGDEESVEILDSVWQDAVDLSSRFFGAGKKITPWQAAELMAKTGKAGRYGSGSGGSSGGGFSGNKRTTHTDIDLTDPLTAKGILNDAISNALGRAASDEQVSEFVKVLNVASRANPVVTTTDTTYVDDTPTASTSTQTGGLTDRGRGQMALDSAMQMPEYGAYQAATTYFNALVASLDSPT